MDRWQIQNDLGLSPTNATVRGEATVHMCQKCGSLIASTRSKSELERCSACGAREWLRQRIDVGPFHARWAFDLVSVAHHMTTSEPGKYEGLEDALARADAHKREVAPIHRGVTSAGAYQDRMLPEPWKEQK